MDPMEPDPALHALYAEYFALYKQLYLHLAKDFKALARVRELAHRMAGIKAWN